MTVAVQHLRLPAVHLLLALFIFALLIWTALDLLRLARTGEDHRARLTGSAVAVFFSRISTFCSASCSAA